ncbi:hypothetical protein ACFV2Z_17480 [Streptomyces sp. NPDC059688]|uniref:Uncharacterized protein n=1 Tax=Streptomyces sp. 900105245 TaxID=3154379 RepID=A0ABV1TY16_9ACTN|nr:hypothetical protein [Streptomyces sp. CB01883]
MIVAATPFSVPWRARPGVRLLEDGAAGQEGGAPPHRSTVDLRSGTAVIRVTPGRLRS